MFGSVNAVVRSERDRRSGARLVSWYTVFGGRRLAARRGKERRGYIADSHGTGIFLVAVGIALLNILDAFYTILFLSHGGTEMNPFVDWVLLHGGLPLFVALKSVGIGLCVAFLTLTKNFIASRIGLGVVLAGYTALLGWHVYLLTHIPT